MSRPVIWCVGRGADASARSQERIASAFGVDLCALDAATFGQRIDTVADAARPRVILAGLPDSADSAAAVARGVDRLRERDAVALIVAAATGADGLDEASLQACRRELLPRATLLALNPQDAGRLVGRHAGGPETPKAQAPALPALARELLREGPSAIAITRGADPAPHGLALDWIATPQACGWLALPPVAATRPDGQARGFAIAAAGALARGFVAADALVLAKMATTHTLRRGLADDDDIAAPDAGAGFVTDPSVLPWMSWGEAPDFPARDAGARPARRSLGLYAIVDSAERIRQVLDAGVRTLQLRIKGEATPAVREAVRRAIADCDAAGAELFVNDHGSLAIELGARGVHLGQEDLLALDDAQRKAFADRGVALGISSHSLWELCRARSLAPRYIACGPVWPTLTKVMPWRAQGLDNLAWWVAMAGTPVVAIGGILSAAQFTQAAACGADGVCAVRVLGDDPHATVPALQCALDQGRASSPPAPGWPHPSLDPQAPPD